MLVWLNSKNRNRSSSNQSNNSSNSSKGKPASEITYKEVNKEQHSQTNKSQIVQPSTNLSKKNPIINKQLHKKYHISKQQLNKITKIFNTYDEDQDGLLSIAQLDNLLSSSNQQLNVTTIRTMFNNIKSRNSEGISLQNLVSILTMDDCEMNSEKDLKNVFKGFDKKNKGYFDLEDYLIISKTIKQQFDMNQLRQAFELMDENKDGVVDYQQFKKIMSKRSEYQ